MLNPTSNRQFWCRWTLSCAAGEILGIGAAGGMAGVVLATIGEPASGLERLANLLLMMLAGALEGYLVGFFQWRVLRQRLGVPGRSWITATATVAVLGWFVGMLFPTFAPNPAPGAPSFEPTPLQVTLLAAGFGLGIGTVFGLGQWLVLRYYAYQAGSWILANALGWGLAMVWIYLAASFPPAGATVWQLVLMGSLAGLMSGLSIGTITGWFLLRLRPA